MGINHVFLSECRRLRQILPLQPAAQWFVSVSALSALVLYTYLLHSPAPFTQRQRMVSVFSHEQTVDILKQQDQKVCA